MTHHLDLDQLHLDSGGHDGPDDAVKSIFCKVIDEHPTIGPLAASMRQSGFELLDQLIAIGQEAAV